MDGWPDRICIQCIHSISRCHAFKTRVEKADAQLRQYIKGLTVVVDHQENLMGQLEIPQDKLAQINRLQIQNVHQGTVGHTIEIQRPDIQTATALQQPIFIANTNQIIGSMQGAHQVYLRITFLLQSSILIIISSLSFF